MGCYGVGGDGEGCQWGLWGGEKPRFWGGKGNIAKNTGARSRGVGSVQLFGDNAAILWDFLGIAGEVGSLEWRGGGLEGTFLGKSVGKSVCLFVLPRAVLDKLASIQMIDVKLPTTDGRMLLMPRYTQPEKDQQALLAHLHLELPAQPPPRIYAAQVPSRTAEP